MFLFCCTLLYVHSRIVIILMGKRELVASLNLSSWCLVMVERLFLAVPQGCLRFVIVIFPDHTHLLFRCSTSLFILCLSLNVGITSFSLEQFSKLSLHLLYNMQTHFVCSRRSFKTEMYHCEMTQTDCSACLKENARCDNMSFTFLILW